jgi:hypothetical protein
LLSVTSRVRDKIRIVMERIPISGQKPRKG